MSARVSRPWHRAGDPGSSPGLRTQNRETRTEWDSRDEGLGRGKWAREEPPGGTRGHGAPCSHRAGNRVYAHRPGWIPTVHPALTSLVGSNEPQTEQHTGVASQVLKTRFTKIKSSLSNITASQKKSKKKKMYRIKIYSTQQSKIHNV